MKTMLEFSKEVLQKVSFDKNLFRKELAKAAQWVKKEERKILMTWCLATFGHQYRDVILEVFN